MNGIVRAEERRKPRRLLLHRELDRLKEELLSLARSAEENLSKAVQALHARDAALADSVIGADSDVDRFEVYLEEECLKILALHQPFAIDLRLVIAVLKINNDLERIDDLAVNISERAKFLAERPSVDVPFDFLAMADKTRSMVSGGLDSLVKMNSRIARDVCASDDEIDALHREMCGRIEQAMQRHPDRIERLTQFLSVSRDLERIADHATNIAEDVIYMVDGEIVRHGADRIHVRPSARALGS